MCNDRTSDVWKPIVADIEDILQAAKPLDPSDRLRLIARLWASLPQETWPKSTNDELAEADRLLAQQRVAQGEGVPWPLAE